MLVLDGFEMLRGEVAPSECARLRETLGAVEGAGRRDLLDSPTVRKAAAEIGDRLGFGRFAGEPRLVRAIYFDKTPGDNWGVPWHQDLTIAVREKKETAGFGAWSEKGGIVHVQPPVRILERMITVRLHLDRCDASNGALRVLPCTHCLGRLSAEAIASLRTKIPEAACFAEEGDVLLMRPLLLHSSPKASTPGHRRILHLEFADFDLPGGLHWYP